MKLGSCCYTISVMASTRKLPDTAPCVVLIISTRNNYWHWYTSGHRKHGIDFQQLHTPASGRIVVSHQASKPSQRVASMTQIGRPCMMAVDQLTNLLALGLERRVPPAFFACLLPFILLLLFVLFFILPSP